MDIKKKADSLVRKFQTRNPFEIIQGLNVILVFAPLVDTRAFYQYFQRNNIIYIDESLTKHEQAFECAHEMGHMFGVYGTDADSDCVNECMMNDACLEQERYDKICSSCKSLLVANRNYLSTYTYPYE